MVLGKRPISTTSATRIIGGAHMPSGWIVRPQRVVVALLAQVDLEDVAQAVGDGERGADRCQNGDRGVEAQAEPRGVPGGLQHELLRQEAVEGRNTGHRQGSDHRHRRRDRHQMNEPAQALDVARSGLVIDDPGVHEERGLEGRVVDDVEDTGHGGKRRADAEEHGDQPEMAHRRERQQRLQVVLEERDPGTDQHGDEAGGRDDVEPGIRAGQRRPEPAHEEDAGLHHRGAVQIGGDRRGRRHGVRQPEVERELRRLGEAATEHEQQAPG